MTRIVWFSILLGLACFWSAVGYGIKAATSGAGKTPPKCTSAISSIRVVGNHTERGPTVWFPKGCHHV